MMLITDIIELMFHVWLVSVHLASAFQMHNIPSK